MGPTDNMIELVVLAMFGGSSECQGDAGEEVIKGGFCQNTSIRAA